MKKATLILLLFIAKASIAQIDKAHYLDLFKRAIKYNDTRLAISSLQGYLTFGDDVKYKDTLSYLYYLNGEYQSSAIMTKEVIDADAENILALERLASSHSKLGEAELAASNFEKLVKLTKNAGHYYDLAAEYYQLKKNEECVNNLKKVLADTNSYKIGRPFTNRNGQQQQVSVLAAAYNLGGVIEMDTESYTNAIKLFDKAIAVFPNFVGASENRDTAIKLSKQKPKAVGPAKPIRPSKPTKAKPN